jgi:ubiquinone biosynthesis monooxygenase Coq7
MILPGDISKAELLEEIIRGDHAGEYGAKRIYQGQISVLKNELALKIMAEQEQEHLDYFTDEMRKRRVRPSVLMPIWHVLGYALGKGTAMLGKTAAMVCTEAVEEVIDLHYQEQLKKLALTQEKNLAQNIEKFRQEELEHYNLARENMKNLHIGHKILYNAIKLGCRLSIEIAKKL